MRNFDKTTMDSKVLCHNTWSKRTFLRNADARENNDNEIIEIEMGKTYYSYSVQPTISRRRRKK